MNDMINIQKNNFICIINNVMVMSLYFPHWNWLCMDPAMSYSVSEMSCCFLQVHCVALLQGVQEGGEMNSPLQLKERQQCEEGFHWLWHQKIPKSLGLFFFFLPFFCSSVEPADGKLYSQLNYIRGKTTDPPLKILKYFPPTNLQSFLNMKNTT